MNVSTESVRVLRERTGAGVVDCKTALTEAKGDIERAIRILRERGKIKAAKKADRSTAEGIVGVYVHTNKKVAGLISVRCETDFVARSNAFQELAHDLAMHVVAMDPIAVTPDDLPADMITEERLQAEKDVMTLGKRPAMAADIIAGKLTKVLAERALLTQPFVKNPEMTVGDLVTQKITELGENIVIKKFVRMTL